MKQHNAEAIRAHLIEHGALDPTLDCHERREIVRHVASFHGAADATCYRHIRALRLGEPAHRPRSDKGKPRAWPPEASDTLRQALQQTPCASTLSLKAMLEAEFPGHGFTQSSVYFWVRRIRATLEESEELPRLRVWSPDHIRFLQNVSGHSDSYVSRHLGIGKGDWVAAVSGQYPLPATLVPLLAWLFGVQVQDLFVEEAEPSDG